MLIMLLSHIRTTKRFQFALTLIRIKLIQAALSMSALKHDQADSSQLLVSITSCDVSDSSLIAKETSLLTYQRKPAVSYALFYLQRTLRRSYSEL